MQNRVPSPRPVRAFTPVPRRHRCDGWTADRQRAFIAALADTGSVRAAAQRINMSSEGAYSLRRQPGAESFAAAWEAAIDHGVQSLADIAIDRARDGVAVPVFWRGEQVGEKRCYNDRLLMFILRHHLPARYGALAPLPPGTRHTDTRAREAAAAPAGPDTEAAAEAAAAKAAAETARLNEQLLRRYQAKVVAERRERLEGNVIAADYTLRQLTHIELLIAIGGAAGTLVDLACGRDEKGRVIGPEYYAYPISDDLAKLRQEAWTQHAEPPRPPLRQPRIATIATAPTRNPARATAQTRACAMMAEAQALWEAAATEESWAKWGGDGGNHRRP